MNSPSRMKLEMGAITGGVFAILIFILGLCVCYSCFTRKKQPGKMADGGCEGVEFPGFSGMLRILSDRKCESKQLSGPIGHSGHLDIPDGKSVDFPFEELAAGTNNFDDANKIGEGGYGAVYLGTLRGQKVAVKRMNLEAAREFVAEIQVLTHVHHTNLVQAIGYCTVGSLFLIYEYVENGTLDRHLHGSNDLPPLSWPARVQIALDTARGLEYIHEHSNPTYIHRDVKSSNILIDKKLHAKVADFGMTKLTEINSGSFSRLVGTFGYMAPEYAKYGDISPKVDVYAFGTVLFEIISAKEAIVRTSESSTDPADRHKVEQRGLVVLFEEVLQDPDAKEELIRLVDPALEGNFPLDSVWKMAQLAAACTQENPALRPSMRTAVVVLMQVLMTLSSTKEGREGNDAVMTEFMSDSRFESLLSSRSGEIPHSGQIPHSSPY